MTTVSEVSSMELVANGLRQGLAFSTTITSRYFSRRFVPATKGKSIRAKLSVVPSAICPSLGYLNWKLYLALVNVSQSLVAGVGVHVAVGSPGMGVGVCEGVAVAVGPPGVAVGVSGAGDGVAVAVGVGDSTDVGVTVGVGSFPRIVRLVGMNPIWVSTLLPVETRALHSSAVWPACKPLTLKLNAAPLVARLPWLPAIAIMKLPPCGPLIATAESAPKRLVTAMLLTSARLAS